VVKKIFIIRCGRRLPGKDGRESDFPFAQIIVIFPHAND
jgi:hypothetical protein